MTVSGTEEVKKAVESLKDLLKTMANVKEVEFAKEKIEYSVKLNYKIAGKKFGKNIKELEKLLEKQDANKLVGKEKIKIEKFELTKDELIFKEKTGGGKEFEGGKIFLDTTVTPELKKEWLTRELMRAVQKKRKELGLNITDKIILYLPETFKEAESIIKSATGSKIVFGKILGEKEEFEFEGKKYHFGVKK